MDLAVVAAQQIIHAAAEEAEGQTRAAGHDRSGADVHDARTGYASRRREGLREVSGSRNRLLLLSRQWLLRVEGRLSANDQ